MSEQDSEAIAAQVRFDDLLKAAVNTLAGGQFQATQLGMNDRHSVLEHEGYSLLSKEYEKNGILSAIIDRPAEDAMAAGFEFHPEASQELRDEFERLALDEVFTDGLRFARLHGGAVIVPIFYGNASLAQPLYRNRRYEIDYFEVISVDRMTVDAYGADGMPLVYNVQSVLNTATGGGQFKLHASRCIYITGRRRPHRQTDTALIWPGVSEGARCLESAASLSRSFKWAERALERKSQAIFKMKGLAQAMQNKLESLVTSRLNLVDAVRSILNTVAIDAEDEFDVSDTNLSSISDTLDSKMQQVAAVSGIPITVLFGRRTTSLNSKGDSDTDTYYRMLNKIRRNMLRNPLAEVVALLGNYVDVSVPAGEALVTIAKLDALSDYEEAEIEERRANAFKARAEAIMLLTKTEPDQMDANGKVVVNKNKAKPLLTPEEARKFLLNEEKDDG